MLAFFIADGVVVRVGTWFEPKKPLKGGGMPKSWFWFHFARRGKDENTGRYHNLVVTVRMAPSLGKIWAPRIKKFDRYIIEGELRTRGFGGRTQQHFVQARYLHFLGRDNSVDMTQLPKGWVSLPLHEYQTMRRYLPKPMREEMVNRAFDVLPGEGAPFTDNKDDNE